MTNKAYIAGPVSGLPTEEVAAIFLAKERELLRQGYQVTNPVAMIELLNAKRRYMGLDPLIDESNRREIISICISRLALCDELHLLPGWRGSEGAQIEHKLAKLLDIKIVYP